MKINLPVTNVEFLLLDSDSVVSKTDLNGVITFINADFIRVSGYTEPELLGVSHNIVRHPDMPTEIFEDMWRSLQAGRPWVGMLKNRCKNGDFYWVLARMTPFYENDKRVGYISVRTKPHSVQLAEATETYPKFRAGKAGNLKIRDGKIVKATLWAKLNFFKHFSIKCRLSLFSFSMLLLLLVVGGIGLDNMNKARNDLRTVYDHHMMPMAQIASIQKLLLTNRLLLTSSLILPTPEIIVKNMVKAEQNILEMGTLWEAYRLTTLTSEEKKLADTFAENQKNFIEDGLKPAISALRANDMVLANSLVDNKIRPLYERLDESSQNLMEIEQSITQQDYQLAQVRYDLAFNFFSGLIMGGILLALWQRLYLTRNIVLPLNTIIGFFGKIAQGNFKSVINIERHDEIGKTLEGLKAMQIKLGFDFDQIKQLSAQNLRIKIALDSISTGVMVADNDRNIIYLNHASADILGKSDADICRIMPDFSVDTLLGTSIDRFHQNPEHQTQLLSSLTATYKARMTLGKRSMALTANPMFNLQGMRQGTVVEWHERTDEVSVETEVESFVLAAMGGDFSKRFDLQGKEGFFRNLGEELNQLLHVSEAGINEVVRILDALAEGDLTKIISNDYQGIMGRLKDDANLTVEKLRGIISQIKTTTDSIHTAVQQIAHGTSDVSARTATQATGLERAAISVQKMANSVQQNTISARHGNQLAIEATNIAGNGLKVIDQVVTTMTDINAASNKMVDIISVIDGIAFQTNILALNAAVEAARAGQEGRGFAVVATEVRSLAQRSALAAGDIKNLIHDSVEKVESGTRLVTQAGLTMEEMVNSIRNVSKIMNQISAASMDQSFGIEQVNLIMTHMDEVTKQNAALIDLSAEAAIALEEQAQNLTFMVNSFKVDDEAPGSVPKVMTPTARLITVQNSPTTQAKPPPVISSNDEWEEF